MHFVLVLEVEEEVVGVCFFCFYGEERVFYVFQEDFLAVAVVLIAYFVLIGVSYSKMSVCLVVSRPGVVSI